MMKTASGVEWNQWESVTCAICEKDSSDLVFETRDWIFGNEGVFRVVRCRDCQLVYLNPRPTLDESWKFYPRRYFAYQPTKPVQATTSPKSTFRRRVKMQILEDTFDYPPFVRDSYPYDRVLQNSLVRRLIIWLLKGRLESSRIPPFSAGHRLLDIGCGNGSYVREMEQLGWEAYGLEMNPDVARYAREQLNLKVLAGHLPDPRFETGFFGVVTMWDSFEHMANPCAVLSDIHRVLTPGGLLIFSTPNFNSIYRRIFGKKWFNIAAPLHYYFYAYETLPRLLSKNGFRLVKVRYPLGTAGLQETLQILLTGKKDEDGSFRNRLIRNVFKWPHRISPRGHLMVYAAPKV